MIIKLYIFLLKRNKKGLFNPFLKILLISSLFHFCKKENAFDCIKPTGKISTEIRPLTSFHSIVVQDKIDVYLKQDNNFNIQITAGKNIIKNIRTEIKNDTLYISNKNKCNFIRDPSKKIEAHIQLPKLKYLKHRGTGNIYTVNPFTQDSIILRIESPGDVHFQVNTHYFSGSTHGNGDVYISGQTNYFYYNFNGTNFIYADNLKINNYTYLESHSVGHAYVNINNAGMDATLFSKGNIYYYGSPSYLKYTSKGAGTVIKK